MSDPLFVLEKTPVFSRKELLAIITTGFFASFILTFNDWGEAELEIATGLLNWGLVFVFFLLFLIIAIFACKEAAKRIGYIITYEAHAWGLMIGVVICLLSAGYLPLFLPGGFGFRRPERMRIGKFIGNYKGWEMGLIAGTFPLVMILFVLILSPIYLLTLNDFYAVLIAATVLSALYAMIPVPNIKSGGNMKEWFKKLEGTSFGLEVYYASGPWYAILSLTLVFFALLVWILVETGSRVGITAYVISLLLAVLGFWIYTQFLKK